MNIRSFRLEGKPLAFQIALFKYADIIISQHGAALANLVWCRPGSTLIEIYPTDLPEIVKHRNHFQNLANCMRLNYRRLEQEHRHSNVDPDALFRELNTVIHDMMTVNPSKSNLI